MQIYLDPVTTTSRPILLFLAEHALPVEIVQLNVLAGEHRDEAFAAISPGHLLPALVDDDLVIGESGAILRYLADCAGSQAYPAERKARAQVDAAMDFVNTQVSRDLGYHHCYPRLFPPLAYASPVTQAEVSERGLAASEKWLAIMDRHMLKEGDFLCGETISLADYFAAGPFSVADASGFDLSPWPRLSGWYERMKLRSSWAPVHAAFDGLVAAIRSARRAA